MLFAFSFTLFKEDIALRLCLWVLVSQGQRIGPDLRPQLSAPKRRKKKKKKRPMTRWPTYLRKDRTTGT